MSVISSNPYNTGHEYTGWTTYNPCNYTTLGQYYTYLPGNMNPVPQRNAMLSSGFYAVPNYKAITTNALTNPHPEVGGPVSCNGHFNISSAYGKQPCGTKYTLSRCSGGGGPAPLNPMGSP